jgi:hypothetical protein
MSLSVVFNGFLYPIYISTQRDGARGGAVVEATNRKLAGSVPDGVTRIFY